ncbi:hypothetical protein B0H34DRAFT_125003 [Crassisporium funariophilum]|nr:hypothetical protein B0H34DRAFT_125003 [Crassisporium funariophilum]
MMHNSERLEEEQSFVGDIESLAGKIKVTLPTEPDEEKQPLLSNGDSLAAGMEAAPNELVGLEAVAPAADGSVQPSAPKVVVMKRLHLIDNMRTILIFLLVLQHSILETVAHIPGFSEQESPTHSLLLTIFLELTKNTVVGLLFFVSGFSSSFTMVARPHHPFLFAVSKTVKATILVAGYYLVTQYLQLLYGPWPEKERNTVVSFYALQKGNLYLLRGPMFYVILLLPLDYTYAIGKYVNLRFGNYSPFVTTTTRYNVAKYIPQLMLQIWTTLVAMGVLRPPPLIVPYLPYFHPEAHFPLQYLITYVAGVNFVSLYRFFLLEIPPQFSYTAFVVRIFLASSALFSLYRHFPSAMYELTGLTTAPKYALEDPGNPLGPLYGALSMLIFVILSTSCLQIFFVKSILKKDWGLLSRVAFLQPFIHMLFVMGFARHTTCIDNPIGKSVFVGLASALCGWSVAMLPVILWRSVRGLVKG